MEMAFLHPARRILGVISIATLLPSALVAQDASRVASEAPSWGLSWFAESSIATEPSLGSA
jgi:hypothetical protein